MQGGIVCVMILGRDGTHGKGRCVCPSRAVYWLDNIIMVARVRRIFAIKAGDLLDLVKN